MSGKAAADLIKCELLAGTISYASQADVLGSIQQATTQLAEDTALALTEAKEVATVEGVVFKIPQAIEETTAGVESTSILKADGQKIKGGGIQEVVKEQVEWTPHGWKHKPPPNVPWKKIVKSTKHGDARYKMGINIKELELHAWHNGQKTTNGKNWKVFKSNEVIGAKYGKETCYMRIECSSNTIHGHPILESEYLGYIK